MVVVDKTFVPSKKLFEAYAENTYEKTPENLKNLAYGLMAYLVDRGLDYDARVFYYDSNNDVWKVIITEEDMFSVNLHRNSNKQVLFEMDNKKYAFYEREDDPNSYFSYNGEALSVSQEGELFSLLNGYFVSDISEKLNNYFSYLGLYYELGNSWNFSLYNC